MILFLFTHTHPTMSSNLPDIDIMIQLAKEGDIHRHIHTSGEHYRDTFGDGRPARDRISYSRVDALDPAIRELGRDYHTHSDRHKPKFVDPVDSDKPNVDAFAMGQLPKDIETMMKRMELPKEKTLDPRSYKTKVGAIPAMQHRHDAPTLSSQTLLLSGLPKGAVDPRSHPAVPLSQRSAVPHPAWTKVPIAHATVAQHRGTAALVGHSHKGTVYHGSRPEVRQ